MVDSEQHHDNALEKEQGESPPLSHSPSKDLKPRSPSPSEHDSASDHEEAKPPLEGGAALRKLDSNVEPEFPPLRKVVVIMLALYLSFFLVALVCLIFLFYCLWYTDLLLLLGPNHYRNCHPSDYRRLPLIRRCWLVR